MQLDNWKKFAAYQNGQNIRLHTAVDDLQDSINEMEKITDKETDPDKLESLRFINSNMKATKERLENAIEKNDLLKEIVKEDYNDGQDEIYEFEVVDYLKCINNGDVNGSKSIKVKMKAFIDGEPRYIYDKLYFNKFNEYRLVDFFTSIGLMTGNTYKMELEKIIGQFGGCTVKKATAKDGQEYYKVDQYYRKAV